MYPQNLGRTRCQASGYAKPLAFGNWGQNKAKATALTHRAFNVNLPLVSEHNALHNSQPQTTALWVLVLTPIKALKKMGLVGGGDAVAGILDRNMDGLLKLAYT